MRTHIGTILFGSVVTYIPEFVQSFLRRATKDRLPELLSSLSRYGYLATIM